MIERNRSQRNVRKIQKPFLYSFDLYVHAATDIQRVFRSHMSRKKHLRALTFTAFRHKLIRLQRFVRRFLTARQIRYKQFSDYLQSKAKKIVLSLKHFYKINSKFDRMRTFQPKD